jgi:hypothetical protein
MPDCQYFKTSLGTAFYFFLKKSSKAGSTCMGDKR